MGHFYLGKNEAQTYYLTGSGPCKCMFFVFFFKFFYGGEFILTPKPQSACRVFSTIELEIIIGSAPLPCNHDH